MSWTLIARKELGDLRRNRQLHWMTILFALLFGVIGYFYADGTNAGRTDPTGLITLLGMIGSFIVPIVALMLSYETVVKRRHNGQLELQLGFPHHRRDVVLGGYVGRFVAVSIVVLAGLWASGAVAFLLGAGIPAAAYLSYLVVALVLALTYVAMGIAISAGVRSPSWASAAAFGGFFLFVLAWRAVPGGVAYVLNGFSRPPSPPWWSEYVATLSPSVASGELFAAMASPSVGRNLAMGADGAGPSFALAVVLGWIVLVPLLGYWRFDRTDL
ncbi:ABC transporter permease [Halovivax limisalsi]|uniref:ABC transporter permease n=1 Tax=Halovivax limisalsi TaxID=1453760 RepID=UPI001FFC5226|nr:ABC transporter permease subunit [Halovivax limisalsi]